MKPVKFEALKARAAQLYAITLSDGMITLGHQTKGAEASFATVLPFILASQAERQELRAFAEQFQAKPKDWLALHAKGDFKGSAWGRLLLRAREAGLELISRWDIRQVGKLIELFPEIAPRGFQGKSLRCYMADNDDADWMVEIV